MRVAIKWAPCKSPTGTTRKHLVRVWLDGHNPVATFTYYYDPIADQFLSCATMLATKEETWKVSAEGFGR